MTEPIVAKRNSQVPFPMTAPLTPVPSQAMTADTLPTTIEATLRLVLTLMPKDEQTRIAALPRNDLASLHLGLGLWMRNYLGLWSSNQALLDATGQAQADDASRVLIEALWQHLQDQRPRLH